MRPDTALKLIGRPVKDLYGRWMGFAVGFSIDTSGDVKTVGVDEGRGKFIEYPGSRIIADKDGFIVVPGWKIEGEALTKEIEMINKRLKSLNDLAREGEIDQHLFEKNSPQYNERLAKMRESCNDFAARINSRVKELDEQEETMNEFLVNLKVYYRSGEMDEASFKAQIEYCNSMKARDAREREELASIMGVLSTTFSSMGASLEPEEDEESEAPVKIQASVGA